MIRRTPIRRSTQPIAPLSKKRQKRARQAKPIMEAWEETQERCPVCYRPKWRFGFARHHIVKLGRIDDPRNALLLCGEWYKPRCHDLFESHRIRQPNGELYPTLTLAHALWLKMTEDAEHFDLDYLMSIYKQALPEPEPIPDVYLVERERWTA